MKDWNDGLKLAAQASPLPSFHIPILHHSISLDFRLQTSDFRLFPVVVELINTGSELMLGRVLNTHQQWLCRQLADLSCATPPCTAPGLAIRVQPTPCRDGGAVSWLIMLPGPPRELRPMFTESVVPLLRRELPLESLFICTTLKTTGIGESLVQEK